MKKTLLFLALNGTLFLNAQTAIFSPSMTISGVGSVNSPTNEEVDKIIDGSTSTKFLDFNHADGMAFDVNLGGTPQVAGSIAITTANDSPNRDPQNYEVLGSNDGMAFTSIASGTIPCVGTRFFERTFTFSNTVSYSYYRIDFTTQCGSDNSIQISEVQLFTPSSLSVGENELNSANLSVLPNPNSGTFIINYSGSKSLKNAIITDINGRIIKEINIGTLLNQEINLKPIQSGLYFITINNEVSSISKKFIVK